MDTELKADEIKEVLEYINLIKDYEVNTQARIDTSITLVWGILLVIAGVTDMLLQLSGNPIFSSYVWIISVFGGSAYAYLTMRLFGKSYVSEAGKKSVQQSKFEFTVTLIIMTIVSLISVTVFIIITISNLVLMIPLIMFIIGTVFLFLEKRAKRTNKDSITIHAPAYIVWVLPYCGVILSLVLFIIIGPSISFIFGLIMGISLGSINIINFIGAVSDQN